MLSRCLIFVGVFCIVVVFLVVCCSHSSETQKSQAAFHILDTRPEDNIYFHYQRGAAGGKETRPVDDCSSIFRNVSAVPPVYWINMDRSRRRASMIHDELEACGIKYHRRVRAFDGAKAERKSSEVTIVEEKLLRISSKLDLRNSKQLAGLASHLLAISTAVRDQSATAKASPYALILEDDASFYFNTDFAGLIASAPSDFGILQLTQSVYYLDVEGWRSYQKDPIHHLWTMREPEKEYFSLQAYIINKAKLKPVVQKLFTIIESPSSTDSYGHDQTQRSSGDAKSKDRKSVPRYYDPIVADIDEALTAATRGAVSGGRNDHRRYEMHLDSITNIPNTDTVEGGINTNNSAAAAKTVVTSPEVVIYHHLLGGGRGGGGPTYVLNIPLIKPLDTGRESLVFEGEDIYYRLHKKSDDFKAALVRDWMSGSGSSKVKLPSFLSLPIVRNATQIKECEKRIKKARYKTTENKSKEKTKKPQHDEHDSDSGNGSSTVLVDGKHSGGHHHNDTTTSASRRGRDTSGTRASSVSVSMSSRSMKGANHNKEDDSHSPGAAPLDIHLGVHSVMAAGDKEISSPRQLSSASTAAASAAAAAASVSTPASTPSASTPCSNATLVPSVFHHPPVYWVNLDRSKHRAKLMAKVLNSLGVTYHRRIRAFDGSDNEKIDSDSLWIEGDILKAEVKSRKYKWDALGPKTPNQVACVASHLLAMHTAVHDTSPEALASPYALILEDDVSFYFNTDFAGLIASAPSDFGILQLTVSLFYLNLETWNSFESNSSHLWTHRAYNKNFYSLQAYVIKKDKVRAFVTDALTLLPLSKWHKKRKQKQKYILTIRDDARIWGSKRGSKLVVNPELVIYTGGRPAYVFNTPLIKSLDIGMNTTIVGHNVTYEKWHRKSDQFKDRFSKKLASGTMKSKLPSFLTPANRTDDDCL